MNKNLPAELNFLIEAENSRKCARLLNRFVESGDVVVPEVLGVLI